jgi:hypothetical protein
MSTQPIFQFVTDSYKAASVSASKLATNAAEEDKIASSAVSFAKLATSARRFKVQGSAVLNTNVSLGSGDLNTVVLIDCTAASRTVTLPSTATGVSVGDWVKVVNAVGQASVNNIIIDPGSGASIANRTAADRLRIDVDDSSVTLIYAGGNNWELSERIF